MGLDMPDLEIDRPFSQLGDKSKGLRHKTSLNGIEATRVDTKRVGGWIGSV